MMADKHLPALGGRKVDSAGLDVIELGSHRRGMLEELEIAHLYILELKQELTTLNEQSTAQMRALRAEFEQLRTRVELGN